MSQLRALIIDDEPDIRELLTLTLQRMGIDCDSAEDVHSANRQLAEHKYNLCLTDLRLPDGSGLDIVRTIIENYADTPVAVITAHGDMDSAIDAMKAGAYDFVNKPVDLNDLRRLVDSAIKVSQLPNSIPSKQGSIIGDSCAVATLKKAISKLSRSQAPVYIAGESGSGKELVARSIHGLGNRSENPFVPVNCGAIPSELVESEFFGHKKGAFTGATQDSEGLFKAANGGTLFLDEVADLPLAMQVKILRAIQEKAIRPVGSQAEIKVDVRVLSATHKDLNKLVNDGQFRQDLFYRLNVIQLDVPPLRERREDIPALTQHILSRLDADFGDTKTQLTEAAFKKLNEYEFPGNIRELENILERAFTLCDENVIDAHDLNVKHAGAITHSNQATHKGSSHFKQSIEHDSIDDYLAEIEKEILLEALEKDRWNRTNAAKTLGISFRSFRYRLKKLGLSDDDD